MKVTKQQLTEKRACIEAIRWFESKETTNLYELYELAKKENKLNWANWYIVRIMTKEQYVQYAVFAAKQVLHIFEEKYPNDDRPRKAIEMAEKSIADKDNYPTTAYANAGNAANAYADADADAAYVYAAYAAANAYAADADDAAYAAYAAANAAGYAAGYAAAKKELQIKILDYGLKLLEKNKEKW